MSRADLKPADLGIGDISSSEGALGRAWNTAGTASMQYDSPNGEATVMLTWNDGEWLRFVADTKTQALLKLKDLGFKVAKAR